MSLRWPSQPKSAPLQNMGVSRLNLNVFLREKVNTLSGRLRKAQEIDDIPLFMGRKSNRRSTRFNRTE